MAPVVVRDSGTRLGLQLEVGMGDSCGMTEGMGGHTRRSNAAVPAVDYAEGDSSIHTLLMVVQRPAPFGQGMDSGEAAEWR